MKRFVISAMLVPFMMVACTSKSPAPIADAALKTQIDSLSYALGLDIGQSLKSLKAEVNLSAFLNGVNDNLTDKTARINPETALQIKQSFFQKNQAEQAVAAKEEGEKNIKAGEEFLAGNAKKPNVKTTASGLQYEVIKEGTGPMPKASSNVKVHYAGTLLDGKEFDSSIKRGEPATFQLDKVIPGWTEGVQLMKVGSKYRFWVPSKLAYGERQAGADIKPNSTLIFEIELLSIEPAAK